MLNTGKNVLARKLSLLNAMVTVSYPDVSLDKNLFAKEGGEEINGKLNKKADFSLLPRSPNAKLNFF